MQKTKFRPRLRLTNYCNRKCPYCFADDFMNGLNNQNHMSLDDINYILRMCKNEGINEVAWQGGEPLIHPDIEKIIILHRDNNLKVNIFTNGLFDSKILKILKDLDFEMLINANNPITYNENNDYKKLEKNLQYLFDIGLINRIALGLNFYEENQNCDFFYDLISKYRIKSVRIDMVRPSYNANNKHFSLNNISNIFDKRLEILEKCRELGAFNSHFDCPFPICSLNDKQLKAAFRNFPDPNRMSHCETCVDISNNLIVQTCFCSLPFEYIKLTDFKSFKECRNFIKSYEDVIRWKTYVIEDCENCTYNRRKICQGGCMGYNKNNDLLKIDKSFLGNHNLHRSISNNTGIPTYEIYLNLQEYLLIKTKQELLDILEHAVLEDIERLQFINNFYYTLCKADIFFYYNKFNEALEMYKEAFNETNYYEASKIVNRIIACKKQEIINK